MPKFACVTDYRRNYSTGYFGHAPGSTSFNDSEIPRLIAGLCGTGRGVVDLGGGNGTLGARLSAFGLRCVTVDPGASPGGDAINADLSIADQGAVEHLRDDIRARIGLPYLMTCLDVAEHIDIEHVADFVFNLRTLADTEIVLSISTRPSSRGNRYHSCILPIETWTAILSLCGFEVAPLEAFDAARSLHVFGDNSDDLIAVSHWQRRNPFRDHISHQHYLHLRVGDRAVPARAEFSQVVSSLLDTAYRGMKRYQCAGITLPRLVYCVHFIQDWHFLRPLLDVWPADRVLILFCRDTIVAEYLCLLKNLCIRNGVTFREIEQTEDAATALADWFAPGAVFATASEGLLTLTHLRNSRIALDARRLGYVTVTLQHGLTMSRHLSFMAEHVAAWDDRSAATLAGLSGAGTRFVARNVGSPKFVDEMLPQNSRTLEMRLGSWTRRFRKTILLGTNLHWNTGDAASDVHAWLIATVVAHPDVLFLLRPHPDDYTVFDAAPRADNLIVLDEIVLIAMDWPVSRICRAVDAVVTTYSTLILDAVAAGKPCAVLPYRLDLSSPDTNFLPPSMPPSADVVDIDLTPPSVRDFIAALDRSAPRREAGEWFASSRTFFTTLASLGTNPGGASIEDLEQAFMTAQLIAIEHTDPERSPHAERAEVSRRLAAFVRAPLPAGSRDFRQTA